MQAGYVELKWKFQGPRTVEIKGPALFSRRAPWLAVAVRSLAPVVAETEILIVPSTE